MQQRTLHWLLLLGFLVGTQSACTLLGANEKAFVNGVIAKRDHRYVVAKEEFKKVGPEHRAYDLAQDEVTELEGIVNELRRAQRDAEIAYDQQRWVAAFVNYEIIAKHQPWDARAQERLAELREKTKIPEVKPKRSPKPKAVAKRAAPKTATKRASEPEPTPEPDTEEVPEARKVEIDEKLRVTRQLAKQAQYRQVVDLLDDVIDVEYRRDDMVQAYVPALIEVAQAFYSETDYAQAARLFEEAYRVKQDPAIEKLLTRTQKLAEALAGER